MVIMKFQKEKKMNQLEVKRILAEAQKMDKTSDEFSDLFHGLNELYFTCENPDAFQQASIVLNMVLHRGDEWMVEILAKLANHLFEVVQQDIKAAHGSFEIDETKKMFFYDLYQNKDAMEQVHKMFRNTVIMKAEEQKNET